MNASGKCLCGCGQTTSIVKRTRGSRAQAKGDHASYIKGHAGRKYVDGYTVENRGYETPCWIWTGATLKGYGRWGQEWAHRKIWSDQHGIPERGTHLHHLCPETLCVRPSHLEKLMSSEHPKRHRRIPQETRDAVRASSLTQRAAAAKFGLSKTHVARIRLAAE